MKLTWNRLEEFESAGCMQAKALEETCPVSAWIVLRGRRAGQLRPGPNLSLRDPTKNRLTRICCCCGTRIGLEPTSSTTKAICNPQYSPHAQRHSLEPHETTEPTRLYMMERWKDEGSKVRTRGRPCERIPTKLK
jgi:hypothetical protein